MSAEMTPEQEVLSNYMRELSEEYYSAGWLCDLEYVLWDVLEGKKRAFAGGGLKEHEIQKLKDLSAACGGWIYWNEAKDENGWDIAEDFIPLEAWKAKYEEWKLKCEKRSDHRPDPENL